VSETHETHAVLSARRHLVETADAYDELDERLHNGSERIGGDRPRHKADPGEITMKLTRTPVPLDMSAATVRMEIAAWATWLARAVIDARDEAGQPWSPPSTDPADILRDVASDHLGTFLADPLVAADFLDTAERHAARAKAAAWPSGERWIRLGVKCPESSTDDMGRRVACGGEYRMWMRPEQDILGDMVCDRDALHRITPAEWQRAMRRKGITSMDGAARLVRTVRLAGGSVA
jgi:hypothetical protein